MATSYWARRVGIGVTQRWIWLLTPAVVVACYLVAMFLSASEYRISAEVQLTPVAGSTIAPTTAQDILTSVAGHAGMGSSMILAAINEQRSSLAAARGWADADFTRWRDETARAFLVTSEAGRIKVSYRGADGDLGEKLVAAIAGRLATVATNEVTRQREATDLQVRQLEAAVRATSTSAATAVAKAGAPAANPAAFNTRLTEVREQASRLTAVATPVVPGDVESSGTRFRLTDRHGAIAFELLLGTLLLAMLAIVIAETTQRALTSERELSEYLNARVVGSIPTHRA